MRRGHYSASTFEGRLNCVSMDMTAPRRDVIVMEEVIALSVEGKEIASRIEIELGSIEERTIQEGSSC